MGGGGVAKQGLCILELRGGFFSLQSEIKTLQSIFRGSVLYLPPHKDAFPVFTIKDLPSRLRGRETSCICEAQSGFDGKSKGPRRDISVPLALS